MECLKILSMYNKVREMMYGAIKLEGLAQDETEHWRPL